MTADDLDGDAASVNRSVERRDWLLRNEKWLSSSDVAALSGGAPLDANRNQYARQLRQSGRILGVLVDRKRLHPRSQFCDTVDGLLEPHPAMRILLELLPADETGWTQALWLFQPTGRLEGRRPADVLHDRPNDVLVAARMDFHGDRGI